MQLNDKTTILNIFYQNYLLPDQTARIIEKIRARIIELKILAARNYY